MFRELTQLHDSVFLFPRSLNEEDVQPNIGIIKGHNHSVLIDAGNSPHHARHLLASIEQETFSPIQTIIYTHHHWDHTFGASTIRPNAIVAHHHTFDYMIPLKEREWSKAHLMEETVQKPALRRRNDALNRAIPNWYDFKVLPPTITFERTMAIFVDNLRIEMKHVGGVHADDSIVVQIPQARIMFLGDCYYPLPYHLRTPETGELLSLNMLANLVSDDYDLYIDGHGDPRTRAELQDMITSERSRQQA